MVLDTVISRKISSGEFKPGEKLPTEKELAHQYNLSTYAVRNSLWRLHQKGAVVKVKGKGSFVAKSKIPYTLSSGSNFTATLNKIGKVGTRKTVSHISTKAGNTIASGLHIKKRDEVEIVEFLRFVNDEPFYYSTSYIPSALVPNFKEVLIKDYSLHKTLREHYGYDFERSSSTTLEIGMATTYDEKMLNVSKGTPLFVIKTSFVLADGQVLEFSIGKMAGDLCTLVLDL